MINTREEMKNYALEVCVFPLAVLAGGDFDAKSAGDGHKDLHEAVRRIPRQNPSHDAFAGIFGH